MSNDFDQILDECIDRLNRGESVEECLDAYPAYATELKSMLKVTVAVQDSAALLPAPGGKLRGKQRLLEEWARMRSERARPVVSWWQRLWAQPKRWAPAMALVAVALLAYGLSTIFLTSDDEPSGMVAITPAPAPASPPVVARTGTLEVWVTDVPVNDISSVYITISNIQVKRSGFGNSGSDATVEDEAWKTVMQESATFELLQLRDVEKLLGRTVLGVGHYNQIRLSVDKVMVTMDGETLESVVPSSKLKLITSFEIVEGETTTLTLDIDAAKSVVVTGSGRINFKPTIKVMVGEPLSPAS